MTADRTRVFDRLARFASRRSAIATLALWGMAEAILLPIVPDVGLGLLLLAAPRRAMPLFGAVVAGALVGSLVLAVAAVQAPDGVRDMLLRVPGIDAALISDANRDLAAAGIAGFAQVGPGAPLKVYTAEWVRLGGGVPGLLLGAVLNRLTRIGPVVVATVAAGWFLGGWMRRHPALTLGVYSVLWIAVYVSILT